MCVYVCVYVCVCVFVFVICVYVYVCVFLFVKHNHDHHKVRMSTRSAVKRIGAPVVSTTCAPDAPIAIEPNANASIGSTAKGTTTPAPRNTTTPTVITPVRKSNRIAVRKRAPELARQNAKVASQAATNAAIKAVHDLNTAQEEEQKALKKAQESARQGALDASLKAGHNWLTMDAVNTTGIKSVHDRTYGVKSKSYDHTKPNDSFDITLFNGQRGFPGVVL